MILTLFVATTLLGTSLFAKEPTQQERNEMAAKIMHIIAMLLMDDGDTTSNTQSLKKTGQTTSYYAGDDGYYQKGVTPSYSRANEVVTDHVTGLQWQDDVETKTITKTWADAQSYCSTLSLDGGGWRLPTVQELQSIVVDGAYNPSIDTTAFVNYNTSSYYWSATTHADGTDRAWIVFFYYGDAGSYDKSYNNYVRCVR